MTGKSMAMPSARATGPSDLSPSGSSQSSVPIADEPYENTLSLDELRTMVRHAWDELNALKGDIHDLPEVPSYSTMLLLSRGGYPVFWEIGKRYQRELPHGSIPWKCEAEIGAGRWKVIREALLKAQAIETKEARPDD